MTDWDRAALVASPIHASIADLLAALPERFPTCDDLNGLVSRRPDVVSGGGRPILFALPEAAAGAAAEAGAKAEAKAGYEMIIHASGLVPTRADNVHDLFNALAWLAFPRIKAALNRAHVAAIEAGASGGVRGVLRDAATLFDEGGAIVACADPDLARALREHEWHTLFCVRRTSLASAFRCMVIGHAVLEKAIHPYRGITAKALVLDVPADHGTGAPDLLRAYLDARGEAFFTVRPGATAEALEEVGGRWKGALTPLPILGMPGWDPANADPAYYDDRAQFRPKRR